MDQAANPDVLLEAVALGAHEDSEPAGLGREPEDGNPTWRQQPQLLAHGENPGAAAGTVQCVVESAGLGQRQRPVVQGPGLYDLKGIRLRQASQLVEPPTAGPHGGWCGGWELDTPGYPIRRQGGRRRVLLRR